MNASFRVLDSKKTLIGRFFLHESVVYLDDSDRTERWYKIRRVNSTIKVLVKVGGEYVFIRSPYSRGFRLPFFNLKDGCSDAEIEEHLRHAFPGCYGLDRISKSSTTATVEGNILYYILNIDQLHPARGDDPPPMVSWGPVKTFRAAMVGLIDDDRDCRVVLDDLQPNLVTARICAPNLRTAAIPAYPHGSAHRFGSKIHEFGLFSFYESKGGWIASRPSGVRVLAVDERDHLILNKERRSDGWDWRIPGGKALSGDLRADAERELKEESGYLASRISHCSSSLDCEDIDYVLHYFIAGGLSRVEQALHGAEDIEVHRFSAERVLSMLKAKERDARIREDRTATFIYRSLDLEVDEGRR